MPRLFRKIMGKKLEFINSGTWRSVYGDENYVVKIPHKHGIIQAGIPFDGFYFNKMEAKLWKRFKTQPDPRGVCYARSRLLKNGWLIMERVRPITEEELDSNKLPKWVYLCDNVQVGWTKNNRLVAYDV